MSDAGAAAATLAEAGVERSAAKAVEPLCLSVSMAQLEPQAQWLASFHGSPAADDFSPPRLGTLADLPALPPSQLAFVRGGRLFALDLPGGRERALTEGAHDRSPRWSPRGTHVAFAREERDHTLLYLVRRDGSALRRLSAVPITGDAAFSADGRTLAFAAEDHDVLVLDLDLDLEGDLAVRGERRLPTPSRVEIGPIFEPSGPRLAYSCNDRLFVADARSERITPRERPEENELLSLAFVPGALLTAGNFFHERPKGTVIQRVPLEPKGQITIEHMPFPNVDAGVLIVAAPRGSKVAVINNHFARSYTQMADGASLLELGDWLRSELSVYDRRAPAQASGAAHLPAPRFTTLSPAWAPDGRHLAFTVEQWAPALENEPMVARGILAVDTGSAKSPPVSLACGEQPAWGPAPPPGP